MVNMPIYFWCKSFQADNPLFQCNIKMSVLPFTFNKKYTIQPQVIFFHLWKHKRGCNSEKYWLKEKDSSWSFFLLKVSPANFKKGLLGPTLSGSRRPWGNLAVRRVTMCVILRQSKPHSIYWLTEMLVPFQFNSQLSFSEIAKKSYHPRLSYPNWLCIL